MKTKRTLIALTALVLAALACQLGTAPITIPQPSTSAPAQPPISAAPPSSNPDTQQDALVNLYQQVSPGIVAIKVATQDGGSLGSGFVYDADGHIVTNYHVVSDSTNNKVEVDFMSGFKTYGTVVGTDLDSDLAIVKVDAAASELHPLPLGDSSALKVGQTVIAIGNPFGLNGTMTVGIISALGRTLDSEHATPNGGQPFTAGDIIQTDAAINPGNSGGPLFNLSGEVIGVNRAIRTSNYTSNGEPLNSGIGFAVSSNIIKRVTPVLIKDGTYDYPYLGMSSISDLGLEEIQALGLTEYTGAYVTAVVSGGPADQAGLKAGTQPTSIQGLNAGGDLITAIDGREVKQFDDLLAYLITNKSPGDTVVLTVLRSGQKQDITITLGKRP
ncbi:MAG TPA: trypsin-like peptidase domain-containing protein [Anaerolineales bacterium]|jgi:2-alkenal reductase|nr:trypsin-like peptidase domain-containing protein [Anaerolineales bacterium]